jgi:hypothetical protein
MNQQRHAFRRGRAAGKNQLKTLKDNPYPKEHPMKRKWWFEGFEYSRNLKLL